MKFKMGRKARTFDKRIKTLAHVLGQLPQLPVPPAQIDWTKGQTEFGMMDNDVLGCCTCSAVYHALQVWTSNTQKHEITEPDAVVLKLYELACGYNPKDPNTDQGGIEQDVLKYLYTKGVPLVKGAEKILGFVEVTPTNFDEMKLTVAEFGVAYIGINVPQSIFDANGQPLPVWDYVAGSPSAGGHAVVIVGYDASGCTVVSWGGLYKLTWAFIQNCCDEAYAIADHNWIKSTGKTPLGLTLAQLKHLMSEFT